MTGTLQINRTKDGETAFWIGGGAKTKTFDVTFVLIPCKDGTYRLADPIFIRKVGTLANQKDQALVRLNVGDIIVTMKGTKPIEPENPTLFIEAYQVENFKRGLDGHDQAEVTAYCETLTLDKIPDSVIIGAGKYHNREGEYFVHMHTDNRGVTV